MIRKLFQTSSLKINIAANFAGRAWVAAISIILIPYYIKFIGIESYGLVGFYAALLGSMNILDFGLSTTINRELAKASENKRDPEEVRNLVFSIEWIYWAIGIVIFAIIFILAPFFAHHWIKAETLSAGKIVLAVRLIGLVIAFQWPISLYNGGLLGLQRQVFDNVIMIIMTTLRSGGVLLALWLVAPTVEVFFIWQAIASILYVLVMRFGLWHYLPKGSTPSFSLKLLKPLWRFVAGMTAVGLSTFLLTQLDKIILSRLLVLSQYGYYVLAYTVAGGIAIFGGPVYLAVFPKLTALANSGQMTEFKKQYHHAAKILSTITFTAGLILLFYARDILLIWIKNPVTVENTALLVQILVVGFIFNSLVYVPYAMLLAFGKTKYGFYQNLIAAIILVPLLFWLTDRYGVEGAALVWVIINLLYITVSIPVMHKIMLPSELSTWYIKDTFLPLLPPLLILALLRAVRNSWFPGPVSIIPLILITIFTCAVSLFFYMKQEKGLNLFKYGVKQRSAK